MTESGWDALAERARGAADHRRAWFLSLIRQGRAAEEAGRSALAAHCRARVEAELAALESAPSASPQPSPVKPRASSPSSPFAALATRREGASRARVLGVLARHGDRLSPAERGGFRAALETAADAQVAALRRRLLDRLLRAARYRRRGSRLAGWKLSVPESAPAGPYNDYVALEETVRRVAAVHPEWAEEFLDVYADMRAVGKAYGELLPGKPHPSPGVKG